MAKACMMTAAAVMRVRRIYEAEKFIVNDKLSKFILFLRFAQAEKMLYLRKLDIEENFGCLMLIP